MIGSYWPGLAARGSPRSSRSPSRSASGRTGPAGPCCPIGRQVPLAERGRAVAVRPAAPSGTARSPSARTPSSRESRPENSPIEPNPTAWWLRPVSSAARVGEQSAVTWNRLYRTPSSAMRVMVGRRRSGRRTCSADRTPHHRSAPAARSAPPQAASTCPIRPQSGAEPASVRFAVPLNAGSAHGQPGPVDRCIRHGHVLSLSHHREPATQPPATVNRPGLDHGITRQE